MSRWTAVSPWVETVSRHLPTLSPAHARVLALWSYGVALTQRAGTTSVAALLAAVLGQQENTVRQRLREWYWEAEHKRGRQRQAVEVTACFAALLGWVLAWWPPSERRLALALDATTLGQRFTVLRVSVVYRGCAIPVAWAVTRANTPGAWRPHWLRLLGLVGNTTPTDWTVLVLADRGLYARWLYDAIQQAGWHPFLRINAGGLYRPLAGGGLRPLASAAPAVGTRWSGAVQAFATPRSRLTCTLLACWEPGHTDRWLVLTDLAPATASVAWYGMRSWIEQGFKDLKRGGWGWHQTKMTAPARAERLWLVLAVATLWMVSVGGQAEAAWAPGSPSSLDTLTLPARPAPRRLSVFRRGQLVVLAALAAGRRWPLGFFACPSWVGEQPLQPATLSARPPSAHAHTYP